MRNGYILLHRQGLTPDEWRNPRRTLAWIDLLTLTNYEDGIVTASYGFLSKRWRVSKNTVYLWIQYWTDEKQIQKVTERKTERLGERKTERLGERFFVLNYAKYQKSAERVAERSTERVAERLAEQRKEVTSIPSGVLSKKNQTNIHVEAPASTDGDLRAFIEFFKKITNRPTVKILPTKDRQKHFNARLKEFSKQEIIRAITEMSEDDFLNGDNDRNTVFLTIDYALRSKSIEKYLQKSNA